MFDLSHNCIKRSFVPIFFLPKKHKNIRIKNSSKSFPLFSSWKIKLNFLNENFLNCILYFFLNGNTFKPLFYSDCHFFPNKNTHKTMICFLRPSFFLQAHLETTLKQQKPRSWCKLMLIVHWIMYYTTIKL